MKRENVYFIAIILVIAIFLIISLKIDPLKTYTVADIGKEKDNQHDNLTILTYFCPEDDCFNVYYQSLASAKESISCAFFDFDLEGLNDLLKEKSKIINVSIVVDGDHSQIKDGPYIIIENKSSYMHNKFCIIDDKIVITGSTNPTKNCVYKNNNNMMIIRSKKLAYNYNAEFDELSSGIYSKGSPVPYPEITGKNITIHNYFCPEDNCEDRIIDELDKAEHSIYFMQFAFTSKEIKNKLILKHYSNVTVYGLFEKSQASSEYSAYDSLKYNNISVFLDKNPAMMHNKVFIIDNETVITGSFNPSTNANKYNDENIIIIKDNNIAESYAKEFLMLTQPLNKE